MTTLVTTSFGRGKKVC